MPKYKVTTQVDLEYEIDAPDINGAMFRADHFWMEYIPEWKIEKIEDA